jgi:CheY-like chemotaxis protein
MEGVGRRALVVDDDDDFRGMVETVLAKNGFDTEGASNACDALRVCYERRPDVVITDIRMPDGNGLGLVECLRQGIFADDHVPVVIVSGAKVNDLEWAVWFTGGPTAYVEKPFPPDSLLEAIDRVIRL